MNLLVNCYAVISISVISIKKSVPPTFLYIYILIYIYYWISISYKYERRKFSFFMWLFYNWDNWDWDYFSIENDLSIEWRKRRILAIIHASSPRLLNAFRSHQYKVTWIHGTHRTHGGQHGITYNQRRAESPMVSLAQGNTLRTSCSISNHVL